MSTLREWHTRLERHFRDLCHARKADGGHPLYTLEHGLATAEVAELSEEVRTAIRMGPPSNVFWLPWVVYAAELGYRFAGEEYWQTFEDRTPGWVQNSERDWLRDKFQRFARLFYGAEPKGAWADHFSIICWPITHAILPRDLQQQLARVLYELRWVLQIEHFQKPESLGALISSRSLTARSRFATFAQDFALAGQIAAALLLKDATGTGHLLHPAALARIAEDLERERLARTWLTEARQRAAQVQLRGVVSRPAAASLRGSLVQPSAAGAAPGLTTPSRPSYQRSSLGIDPRLLLRPAGGAAWTVELEIPELQHLLESDEWRDLLTRASWKVAGGGRRPFAPGRLLYGSQRVRLERWPRADEVLLAFDGASPAVAAALTTTCLLPPGPTWLFKISPDGRAYHIRSNIVRPSADYLVLSTRPFEYDSVLTRADVDCTGVFATRIAVPAYVPPSVDGLLREIGLVRASSVRIAPVGLPPLFWDGEGHAEWLTTDTPVLSVERETESETVELLLDGADEPAVRITGETENPAYVELPPLAPGAHTVRVRVAGARAQPLCAALEVTLRAPRPWTGALGEQHAVQVTSEPADATFEDLVTGRFRMDVRGPPGLRIESTASLWSYRRERLLYRKSLPGSRLPFDLGAWQRAFVHHFLDDQPVQENLDSGWALDLEFAFGAVAAQRFVFLRDLVPLRFAVRTRGRDREVKLLDDTGLECCPGVSLRSFEEPDVPREIPVPSSGKPLDIPKGGGLLEAAHGDQRVRAVVAPAGRQELGDLRLSPRFQQHYRRAPDGLRALTGLAALWAGANPQGTLLARLRQCQVLQAILDCIVRSLCGSRWGSAERAFLRSLHPSPHALTFEITSDPRHRELRQQLEAEVEVFRTLAREERAERFRAILASVREFRDIDPTDAALALLVMSVPERVPGVGDVQWHALLNCSVMMRAARFLVVATHRASRDREITAMPLYAGWN